MQLFLRNIHCILFQVKTLLSLNSCGLDLDVPQKPHMFTHRAFGGWLDLEELQLSVNWFTDGCCRKLRLGWKWYVSRVPLDDISLYPLLPYFSVSGFHELSSFPSHAFPSFCFYLRVSWPWAENLNLWTKLNLFCYKMWVLNILFQWLENWLLQFFRPNQTHVVIP